MSRSWSSIAGWLGFVLVPLALGILLDHAAADRPELQRAALLLIVFGLAMAWMRARSTMHVRWVRITRTTRSRRYVRRSH